MASATRLTRVDRPPAVGNLLSSRRAFNSLGARDWSIWSFKRQYSAELSPPVEAVLAVDVEAEPAVEEEGEGVAVAESSCGTFAFNKVKSPGRIVSKPTISDSFPTFSFLKKHTGWYHFKTKPSWKGEGDYTLQNTTNSEEKLARL